MLTKIRVFLLIRPLPPMSVFPNPPPPSAADVILCERSLTQINQANSNTCPTQYFVQA